MEYQQLLQIRKAKGIEIAKSKKITLDGNKWLVPSQTSNKQYEVVLGLGNSKCTCPDYKDRGIKCKHIFAVEMFSSKQVNPDGSITLTQTKRITYPQSWANYTKAQTEEGRLFKELLKDLVENVPEEPYVFGRPRVPLKIALFCAIDKVYSMQSSRRAYSRYREAQQSNMIAKAPNYNVINKILNDIEITPILHNLLDITAMPLRSVETKFSPDSTGFRTTKFSEYCNDKHNLKRKHRWIKCHAITGNNTNIVASAVITEDYGVGSGDISQLIPLVNHTAGLGFNMEEVSADKAYNSIENYNAIHAVGATAYIPYKKNITALPHTGNKARLWRKMFHYFQLHQDEFMEHYHNRSNVETTFFAIKSKFGDCLKNKNYVSQANELLCKLIAYNITVLISAMYELKIEPKLL